MVYYRLFELFDNIILGYVCNEIIFDLVMGIFELVLIDVIDGGVMSIRERCVFDELDG